MALLPVDCLAYRAAKHVRRGITSPHASSLSSCCTTTCMAESLSYDTCSCEMLMLHPMS